MDSGTIITAAVLIALVLVPFIFTGRKYRKQKKEMSDTLVALAGQVQGTLSSHEVGSNFGIGIDRDGRYLFFARKVQNEVTVRSVALAEVSRCKVNTSGRTLEEGEKVIDRVELKLYPVASAQPEVVLEIYNSASDTLTIRGELVTAVKWEQIISGLLTSKKHREPKTVRSKQVVRA